MNEADQNSWKRLPPPTAKEDLAYEGFFTDSEAEEIVHSHPIAKNKKVVAGW